MPRIARAVAPGLAHHVTQRGNFGQPVFDDDQDRRRYLGWLAHYADRHGTRIWAYCLMTNHVHFIAVPETGDGLARTFSQVHRRNALDANRRRGRLGHLWQERFYSCALDDAHLYAAVRYVERNPVRAGLVRRAEAYPWSSARSRVAGTADPLLSAGCPLVDAIADWADYLASPDDQDWMEDFRAATRSGRPVGSASFVELIEARLDRRLRVGSRGRPRKRAFTIEK